MRRHLIALAVGAAGIAAGLSTNASAARFDTPVAGEQEADVTVRCAKEDWLKTNDEAVERINWAIGCNVLAKKWEYKFYYDVDENGNRIKRDHFLYPTFAHDDHLINNPATWPVWTPARDAAGKLSSCTVPDDVKFYSICTVGCYAPDQQVLFSTGYERIDDALRTHKHDLVTLAPNATLERLVFQTNEVHQFTVDGKDALQDLLTFQTRSGGSLRVTTGHPLVTADGTIHEAKDVKAGDSLVRADGSPDEIVGVEPESYFGKVYNVEPITRNQTTNVVVAQGFLNGSSRYQNDYQKYLNRVVVRETTPADVLPQ